MPRKDQNKPLNEQHHCFFCVSQTDRVDYKNTKLLHRYISSYGKIVPRKRNHVCAFHQRKLSNAIKRARLMALLPFVASE